MRKGWIVLSLLTLCMGLLAGCLAPDGMLVSDGVEADEYMTNNPQLIEKYGEEYSFVMTGRIGGGEINTAGKSGDMVYTYLVNDTDSYEVSFVKEKRGSWTAKALLYTSCSYACEEINLFFSESVADANGLVSRNGFLSHNGEQIEIIASLGPDYLRIEDAKSLREYEEGWTAYGKEHWDDLTKDWETLDQWEEKRKVCTLFYCDVESNFDEFTATVQPEYQDYLGKDLTVLHFHAEDE